MAANDLTELRAELLDWAEGRRSHLNEFMGVEADPADRQQTLVAVAQADAAEVQKLAAALAALDSEATAEQRGAERALRVVRLVEGDMAEQALLAWRSADARRGLSDHAALEIHADALTRWSERLRMAFDGEDYRSDREDGTR